MHKTSYVALAVLTLLATLLLSAPQAKAKGAGRAFLGFAATETTEQRQADTDKVKVETTIYNFTGGYILAPFFTLGVKYWSHTQSTNGSETVTSGYGPSIGLMHDIGLFAMFSYLLTPTKEYSDRNGKNSYRGGRGSVIDVGYVHSFSDAWGAGLQLTQSNVGYAKRKLAGQPEQELAGKWEDRSIYPYLNVFIFL